MLEQTNHKNKYIVTDKQKDYLIKIVFQICHEMMDYSYENWFPISLHTHKKVNYSFFKLHVVNKTITGQKENTGDSFVMFCQGRHFQTWQLKMKV